MEQKNNVLGENIRRLRDERGISQEELAKRINVSRPSISAYEKGISEPSVSTLILIAKVLNVSLDMLAGNARNSKKVVVLDTSVLMKRPVILGEVIDRFDEVIVPRVVVSELNNQKDKRQNNRAWLVMMELEKREKSGEVKVVECLKKDGKNDDRIFAVAVERAQEALADKVYMFSDDIDFAFMASNNVPNLEKLTFVGYAAMFSDITSSDPIISQNFFSKIRARKLDEAKAYYKDCGSEIDVNMTDPETGFTPLIQAVRNRDKKAVEYLITLPGIDLDRKDNHKYFFTPLLHASQLKDDKALEILRYLLERGADYDAGSGGNNAGNTPLMVCAWGGFTEGVKALMEYDVCFNQQDSNGYTALTKACIRKHYDIAAMLIGRTDIKIRSRENKRADDYIDLKDIAARGLIGKFSGIRKDGKND
ncbi:MAG: helix-turn-helix domain-containing protein [Clostridia bacterium]|nr:helix-turn-helix domain-containing protein [Clostridia bacterium]